jgi:hypothetical protein
MKIAAKTNLGTTPRQHLETASRFVTNVLILLVVLCELRHWGVLRNGYLGA